MYKNFLYLYQLLRYKNTIPTGPRSESYYYTFNIIIFVIMIGTVNKGFSSTVIKDSPETFEIL